MAESSSRMHFQSIHGQKKSLLHMCENKQRISVAMQRGNAASIWVGLGVNSSRPTMNRYLSIKFLIIIKNDIFICQSI